MQVQGANGSVELFEHHIVIKRSGFRNALHGLRGDRSIPLSSIIAVQFSPAGFLSHGYIKLALPGGADRKLSKGDAYKDENTVFFSKAAS